MKHPRTTKRLTNLWAAMSLVSAAVAFCIELAVPESAAGSTLFAWGDNTYNQTNIPFGLTNATAIAAGPRHSLALLPDRTVVAWGDPGYGALDLPPGLSNVVAIAAGWGHNLALKTDGTITAWGINRSGQSTVPAGLTNALAIAAGENHSLAVVSNGLVMAWGDNSIRQTSVPTGLSNVVAVAGGGYHSLALRRDGTVAAWGKAVDGQLSVPADLTNALAIAAGSYHSLALRDDGTVVAWGANNYGQSSVPAALSNVVSIAARLATSMALCGDGTVVMWGELLPCDTNLVAVLGNVTAIALGGAHRVVRLDNGSPGITIQPTGQTVFSGTTTIFKVRAAGQPTLAYQWIHDGTNVPGATNVTLVLAEVRPEDAGDYSVLASNAVGSVTSAIAPLVVQETAPYWVRQPSDVTPFLGSTATLSSETEGSRPQSFQWFFNGTPMPNATNAQLLLLALRYTDSGAYSLLASNEFGSVTSTNAQLTVVPVAAWERYGQLPPPAGTSNAVAIAAGRYHNLALKADGTVVGWTRSVNFGDFGQITPLAALSNVVAIALGAQQSYAIRHDRSVAAYGPDWGGVVSGPSGETSVLAIAAGHNENAPHVVVLRADGTLRSWGPPSWMTNFAATLTQIVAIAVGDGHALALRRNGTVVAWGWNEFGQTNVPPGLTHVVAISAGFYHSLALRADGTVAAWGRNLYGETQVPSDLTNAVAIAGGGFQSLALRNDGTLVFWGRAEPYPMSGTLSNVTALSVTADEYMALIGDGSPAVTLQPRDQTASSGTTSVLGVFAAGIQTMAYQWLKDGAPIPGATAATLSLSNPTRRDSGVYSVTLSNVCGSTVSSNATLLFRAPQRLFLLPPSTDGGWNLCFGDADGTPLLPGDVSNFEPQISTNLLDWFTLPNELTLSNGLLFLHDSDSTNSPARFYRVLEH